MGTPEEERAVGIVRAVHLGQRAPVGRLVYLADRLEAALGDGTLVPSVLATISVLRTTVAEAEAVARSCLCGRTPGPGICQTNCGPGTPAGGHCSCIHTTEATE